MEQMEDKLSAILGNPQMMQQIMSMAQSLSQAQPPEPSQKPNEPQQKQPPPKLKQENPLSSLTAGIDPGTLQKIFNIAKQSGIDRNQQALLKALSPYLSKDRILKLEKAMRAAKIASIASTALGSNGISFLTGR